MTTLLRVVGVVSLLAALGATAPGEQAAAQGDPAATPVAEDGDVQAAQVSYAPLFDPISVCITAPLQDGVTIGSGFLWSNFAYSNTDDEPLLFEYTVTDTEGSSVAASAGEAEPGSSASAQIVTTVTALDTLTWEVARTVTITVTGTESGEEATETYSLACPVWPLDNFAVLGSACPDDPGPYQAGDEFRFPFLIDNSLSRSAIAIDELSLTTDDGTFEPVPPTSLGQDEQVEVELVHVLTAEEIGQSVGIAVTYTFTYGPPPGSAAEGELGDPFNLTFETGTGICAVQGGDAPTATPEPTETPVPTAEPTATGEPEPTAPAPTAVAPTQTPSGAVASLPDTGSGGAGDPVGHTVLLLALMLGVIALGAGVRLRRRAKPLDRR